jgi:hypothetical protein
MAENTQTPGANPQQSAQPQPPAPPAQQRGQAASNVYGNINLGAAQPQMPANPPPVGSDQTLPVGNLYGENGMLTHAGMVRTLRTNGSVTFHRPDGKTIHITREQDLPGPAAIANRDVEHAHNLLADAKTEEQRKQAQNLLRAAQQGNQRTSADIDAEIARLQEQKAALPAQTDKAKK